MPVVIDQFEIVRDSQKIGDAPANSTDGAAAPPTRTPTPLGPQDIDATLKHLTARALRLRAT